MHLCACTEVLSWILAEDWSLCNCFNSPIFTLTPSFKILILTWRQNGDLCTVPVKGMRGPRIFLSLEWYTHHGLRQYSILANSLDVPISPSLQLWRACLSQCISSFQLLCHYEFGQVITVIDCDRFFGMCDCTPRWYSTLAWSPICVLNIFLVFRFPITGISS